jgi:hypothetical protein
MSPSAGGETAVEESKSDSSASRFSQSVCNNSEESMDPFASSREDDNEKGGEHSNDKGEYAEEEIPHIREVTRANAMLTNIPDEDNTALAKCRAIQSVMQDQGLSAVEGNRKIQDIMAGRVKLAPVVREEVVAKSSNAGKAAAAEGSESDCSESKYSRSMSNDEEESMNRTAASEDKRILMGGEAMVHDMPNKDDTTLAKRKAVQSVVQDRSLSVLERNKKIQDIMAGKVVLPRVVAAMEPASTASLCRFHKEKRNAESLEREEYSRRNRCNGIDRANS